MFFRSMEPTFSARVGEVYVVSRYRTLTEAYAISVTLGYLPSPRLGERAGRIQKDAGDELFLQLPLFGKNCRLRQMPEHASLQDHLAHCGTLAREK